MRTLAILCITLTLAAHAQLDQGLVGNWPVNNNLDDVTGNGLDGISTLPYIPTSDRAGNPGCAIISEEGGFYTNNSPLMDLDPAGSLSMSFWMQKQGTGNEVAFIRMINGPVSCDFTLYNSLATFGSQAQMDLLAPPANVFSMDQAWHHFVCVYDDRDWSLYIDGMLVAQNTNTTEEIYPGPASFNAGCAWGMAMDDLRVYDRALSPAEALQLFQLEADCALTTGIADLNDEMPLVLSNGNGSFTMQLQGTVTTGTRLCITDALGRSVDERSINGPNVIIDLQNEAPGLYYVSILNGTAQRTIRVVRD